MLAVRTHLSTAESCSETRQKRRGGHPVPGPWSSTVDPSSHRPPKVFAANCVATGGGQVVSGDDSGAPGRLEGRAPRAQKLRTGAKALRTQSAETAPTGSTNHREVGGTNRNRHRSILWPIVVLIHFLSSDGRRLRNDRSKIFLCASCKAQMQEESRVCAARSMRDMRTSAWGMSVDDGDDDARRVRDRKRARRLLPLTDGDAHALAIARAPARALRD